MSLRIYFNRSDVPTDLQIIDNNDIFFKGYSKIPDNPLVVDILRDIDGAVRDTDRTFFGRFAPGALDKSFLSTGTKVLLNIIQHPDKCFNVIECGDNALIYLSRFTDGYVLCDHIAILDLPDGLSCDVVISDRHFTNFDDVVNCLYYKEVPENEFDFE